MLKPECNVAVQRFTKYLPDGKMVNYSNGSQNVWGRKRLKREHLSVGLGLFVSTEIVVGIRINNTCSLFVISVQHTPLDTPAPETRPDETGGFWGIRQAAIILSCDVGHVFFMAIIDFCHQISTELELAWHSTLPLNAVAEAWTGSPTWILFSLLEALQSSVWTLSCYILLAA